MNVYMDRVGLSTFSYFDTVTVSPEPERFYHDFVLGRGAFVPAAAGQRCL